MESSPTALLRKSVFDTLSYFDKYNYPLTTKELWFWQTGTKFKRANLVFYLDNQVKLVDERYKRALYSQKKLKYITPTVLSFSRLPFIKAVFITGALAMSNSPADDDIDLMIITNRSTLWLTRILITFYLKLKNLRRSPYLSEHSSDRVSDKICDNLWLDADHLLQVNQSLYTAHELLQAKCIYDKGGAHRQLLAQNLWAKDYLPIAYRETLKQTKPSSINNFTPARPAGGFYILNLFLFLCQYLYMRPHLTAEKVGLGYAYFHPAIPERSRRTRV
jgi:hypothetical protein